MKKSFLLLVIIASLSFTSISVAQITASVTTSIPGLHEDQSSVIWLSGGYTVSWSASCRAFAPDGCYTIAGGGSDDQYVLVESTGLMKSNSGGGSYDTWGQQYGVYVWAYVYIDVVGYGEAQASMNW